MSNTIQTTQQPRVVFFGMQCRFSYLSLRALLEAPFHACAVVLPAEQAFEVEIPPIQKQEPPSHTRPILPVLNASILDLARERNIPVWKVQRLSNPDTIHVLKEYQPDVICVACFSKRIPRDILNIPLFGCLNVHPSLLPANRGPEPLFWTFREGSTQTGITIHLMDEALDSGPIVVQKAIEIPDGISYYELEDAVANLGGNLLAQSVWDLYNDEAVLAVQDEKKSSFHSFPRDEDFVVPVADWSARHVYNFICGLKSWGTPIHLLVENKTIQIKSAISYSLMPINPDKGFWITCKQGGVIVE